MKRAFFIPVLLLNALAAAAPRLPRIEFDQPAYSFGEVAEGQTVDHDFVFRNAGNAPLTISAVNTSCGCTSAAPDPRKIKPGKTGRIHVQFDSAGREGAADKTIRVFSDDTVNKVVELRLTGVVRPRQ